jgi:hypothetical protein
MKTKEYYEINKCKVKKKCIPITIESVLTALEIVTALCFFSLLRTIKKVCFRPALCPSAYQTQIAFIFASQSIHLQKAKQNLRIQQTITFIGIVLFVVKIVAWYLTHSVAILTDALESTVNVLAGLIGVYSLHVSARPRDKDHPYGHGKANLFLPLWKAHSSVWQVL